MKNYITIFFCIFLLITAFSINKPLLILTEDSNPPLNFTDKNGSASGCAVDVVMEIQKRIGDKTKIQIWPWKRALETAMESREFNVVLFSTTFTEERNKYLKWVGPLKYNPWYLWVKKESNLKVNSLEDMKKLASIGVYRGDIVETYLIENGFKNLISVRQPEMNLRQLAEGRITGWVASGGSYVPDLARKEKIPAESVKSIFTVNEVYLYIAFSKNIPDDIFKKWKNAFEEMKKDGTLEKIYKKWNLELPLKDPLENKK